MAIHASVPLELPIEGLSETKQDSTTGLAGAPIQ